MVYSYKISKKKLKKKKIERWYSIRRNEHLTRGITILETFRIER